MNVSTSSFLEPRIVLKKKYIAENRGKTGRFEAECRNLSVGLGKLREE